MLYSLGLVCRSILRYEKYNSNWANVKLVPLTLWLGYLDITIFWVIELINNFCISPRGIFNQNAYFTHSANQKHIDENQNSAVLLLLSVFNSQLIRHTMTNPFLMQFKHTCLVKSSNQQCKDY